MFVVIARRVDLFLCITGALGWKLLLFYLRGLHLSNLKCCHGLDDPIDVDHCAVTPPCKSPHQLLSSGGGYRQF